MFAPFRSDEQLQRPHASLSSIHFSYISQTAGPSVHSSGYDTDAMTAQLLQRPVAMQYMQRYIPLQHNCKPLIIHSIMLLIISHSQSPPTNSNCIEFQAQHQFQLASHSSHYQLRRLQCSTPMLNKAPLQDSMENSQAALDAAVSGVASVHATSIHATNHIVHHCTSIGGAGRSWLSTLHNTLCSSITGEVIVSDLVSFFLSLQQ